MNMPRFPFAVLIAVTLIAGFAQPLPAANADDFPYPVDQPIKRPLRELAQTVLIDPDQQDNKDLVASLDTVLDTLGRGFNSFTDKRAGDCVSGFIVGPKPTSFAPSFDIKLVETYEQFAQETSAEASVSGGFGSFSASVKTKFEQASKSNGNTQFLLVRETVIASPDINIKNPRLNVPEPAGNDPESLRKFFRQCGDQYISKIQMGGTFIAVLTFSQSENELKSSLGISGTVSGFGGSGSASFNTQLNSLRGESSLQISATQIGGDGSSGLPEFNLDSLLAYTRDFPKKINAATVAPVGITAESYVNLGVDLPDRLDDVRRNYDAVTAAAFIANGHGNDLKALRDLLADHYGIPAVHSENDVTARIATALLTTQNDYKAMTSALATCANAFWVEDKCAFDPRYLNYKLPSPGPMFIRQIDTRSTNPVNLDVPADMTLELRGANCWNGDGCDHDGTYSGDVGRVNVNWPKGGDVYRGRPMTVTAGRVTVATFDTDYSDNGGELFAFVY